MSIDLFERVVVPIADPDDAANTARVLHQFTHPGSEIVIVYVVEKGKGVPDKASVEQAEGFGEDSYESFLEVYPAEAESDIHVQTLYGRDVAETIIEGAEEMDATAIAFVPRAGSRLIKFLTGNTTLDLVEQSTVPVLALPTESDFSGIDA